MSSALNGDGSSRAWRKLRAAYAATLPCACWRCGEMIEAGSPWHLGHVVDRAAGGGDERLAPEHASCSSRAGARLAVRRRRWGALPPSRDW